MNQVLKPETHEGLVLHPMNGIRHADVEDWCAHCALHKDHDCLEVPCMKSERKDSQDVIFLTSEQAALVRLRGEWRE
jgi:hypothetical protein